MVMSDPKTVTEHRDALLYFVDRFEQRRLFASYLHKQPPKEKILFFYGDGGNGKSLLLKHLKHHWCKLLSAEQWQNTNTLPETIEGNEEFVNRYLQLSNQQVTNIPCIYYDFDKAQVGELLTREAWSALLSLRKELATYKIKMPLFDYAILRYMHIAQGKSREEILKLLPQQEIEFFGALFDLVLSTDKAVGGFFAQITELFTKHFSTKVVAWLKEKGLDEKRLNAIKQLDVKTELLEQLPTLFGEDLNRAMQLQNAPERLVLMFDTHEAFWGTQRLSHSTQTHFYQDAWLRQLLNQLYIPNNGIIVVIAGREKPIWDKADSFAIEQRFVDTHFVGHVNRQDSRKYLNQVLTPHKASSLSTNSDEYQTLIEKLIDYAEVETGQVHPLHLGLSADIVLMAWRQGQPINADSFTETPDYQQKSRQLMTRLLKYCPTEVENAVIGLSAARSFSEELFYQLAQQLHFQATQAFFGILVNFSFVWVADEINLHKQQSGYRIHTLLSKTIKELESNKIKKAHQVLENIYREQTKTEPVAIAEAIYHTNQQDAKQGFQEWYAVITESIKLSKHQLTSSLIDISLYLEIQADFDYGLLHQQQGDFYRQLSQFTNAIAAYHSAINSYKKTLVLAPEYVYALNNKGNVQRGVGDLLASHSDYDAALKSYNNSIESYDKALTLAPEYVDPLNNKGNVHAKTGDLLASLSNYNAAQESYQKAIQSYDNVLALVPEYVDALNNKGIVQQSIGDLLASRSDYKAAEESYQKAVESYDNVLVLAPEYVVDVLNNKGIVQQSIGHLLASRSNYNAAEESYQKAIQSYDNVLALAPEYVDALNNKGIVQQSIGDLLASRSNYKAAQESYQKAIESYDTLLVLAPEDVNALNNKGNVQLKTGDLVASFSDYKAAEESYNKAIESYDNLLVLASEHVGAFNNKGNAHQCIGNILASRREHNAALQSYQKAVESYDTVLALAPEDVDALNNKGIVQQSIGDLLASRSDYNAAEENYLEAIQSYDNALALAPEYVYALNNKGIVQQCIGDLRASRSEHDAALQSYRKAIESYDKAHNVAPNLDIANEIDRVKQKIENLGPDLSD